MKKLLLLLLTAVYFNLFCDDHREVQYIGNKSFNSIEEVVSLPDEIILAISLSDVNKTVTLMQNTLINNEFKSELIKEAQKRVKYYHEASSSIFLSPKDSINFILSVLTIAGCYKAGSHCLKEYEPLELSLLVPNVLNTLMKQIQAEISSNLKPENVIKIVANIIFNNDIRPKDESATLADDKKLKDAWFEIEKSKLIYSTGIIITSQISLYAFYKMMSSLTCSSACKKFKDAQTIYLLVNSWNTIQA